MSLKSLSNIVTSKVGRQILTMRKNSPALLFAAGVVGVVGTVVLASRATLKLEEILEEAHKDLEINREVEHPKYSETDRVQDRTFIYLRTGVQIARLYGPAVIVGAASIAALAGSHVILNRRYVAVTAAYGALDRAFKSYRHRVVSDLGIDKDREYLYDMETLEIVEETPEGPAIKTVQVPGPRPASPYARFFDECSVNWSRDPGYNQMFLSTQQSYCNDKLRSQGHLFLNEVLDMLGLSRTAEGAIVGWIYDPNRDPIKNPGDNYVDFGIFEGDKQSGWRFALGHEKSVLLDFNVDGIIWDKI